MDWLDLLEVQGTVKSLLQHHSSKASILCGDSLKMEIELPYDPAILLLSTHTEETRIERNTCNPKFTEALFTIAGHGSNLYVHRQTNG